MENNLDPRRSLISIIEQQSATDGINGRYHNVSRLDDDAGQGHFSLVFKADDNSSGKQVVLKFFNPLLNDEYGRRCFYRESDILESLRGQPNIIQLIEPKCEYVIRMTRALVKSCGNSLPAIFLIKPLRLPTPASFVV